MSLCKYLVPLDLQIRYLFILKFTHHFLKDFYRVCFYLEYLRDIIPILKQCFIKIIFLNLMIFNY